MEKTELKDNELSEKDINEINEILSQKEGSSVKGKVICLDKYGINDFPENKEDVGYHLAIALDDEENLAWYQKLARERRRDFLKNCLRITLDAFEKGVIKKTKAAYFAGIVRFKTNQQELLEEYKRKHTTLYGYPHRYEK